MPDYLSIAITKAGKEAAFNVSNTGFELEISHIAFGDVGWNPVNDDEATELRNEILKVPIISGEKLGRSQIHLNAKLDGDAEFIIREVGIFLSDGTLFGVYSNESQDLAHKTSGVELILTFDLILSTLPPDSVSIVIEGGEIASAYPSIISELIKITLGNIKTSIVQIDGLSRITKKLFKSQILKNDSRATSRITK